MNAAVLHAPRDVRHGRVPAPVPGPEDVLVRVALAGICGTDIRIWRGDRVVAYPRILGHELVGVVEAVGDAVRGLRPGTRVVIEPNYGCGRCPLCREGNGNLCPDRVAVGIDVDGGFAELVRVPARCCWPAPEGLTDDELVLAEPLAVVVRAVHRAAPTPGATAAVVGAGPLGLLALQVLRARGARVLVVGRTGRRLELARALGADATHALAEGSATEAARRFSGREGVEVVVETAGTPDAVADALALVRPGGRVALTGLPPAPTPVAFAALVRREITVTGSMIYQAEFGEALRLLAAGTVRGRPLLTHRFPLAAIAEAFEAHESPAAIKVVVLPGGR